MIIIQQAAPKISFNLSSAFYVTPEHIVGRQEASSKRSDLLNTIDTTSIPCHVTQGTDKWQGSFNPVPSGTMYDLYLPNETN